MKKGYFVDSGVEGGLGEPGDGTGAGTAVGEGSSQKAVGKVTKTFSRRP